MLYLILKKYDKVNYGVEKEKQVGGTRVLGFGGDVNGKVEKERASSPVVGYIVDPTFLRLRSSPLLILHYPQLRLHLSPFLYLSYITLNKSISLSLRIINKSIS